MSDTRLFSIQGNIWKLYAINICNGFLISIPIIALFFSENGLSLKEIFLLQAIFSIALLSFEIPSGYLSDRWGRKKTTLTGCVLLFIGYVIYGNGETFWGFALAEVIIGIGESFLSGTLDALTYDTLLETKREKEYRRIGSHQNFLHFGSEALAALLGGALAAISLRTPIWAMLFPLGLSILFTCMLREPSRKKLQSSEHLKEMWNICLHTLWKHKGLRSVTLLHSIITSMTLTLFWFTQPYQSMIGLPVYLFGATHFVIVATGAAASKTVPFLEKRMDDRQLLLWIAISVVLCYVILSGLLNWFGLAAFLIGRISWSLLGPLTNDMVNRMTHSDVRATVLSLKSFGGRLIFGLAWLIFSFSGETLLLQQGMFWIAIIGGISLFLSFASMRGVWKEIPA